MSAPPRTADTMSDAIALSSPSGRMSKRARAAAEERLRVALFGPSGDTRAAICGERPQEPRWVALRRSAANLRNLAARGMSVRKFTRAAEQMEREADTLEREAQS